ESDYGPTLFGNRRMRTRMSGGVGGGGEKPLPTRCVPGMGMNLWGVSPLYIIRNIVKDRYDDYIKKY
ncbi:hypothetical protein WDW89_13920, partial [Deltaproteobacteria bacterium TL4]